MVEKGRGDEGWSGGGTEEPISSSEEVWDRQCWTPHAGRTKLFGVLWVSSKERYFRNWEDEGDGNMGWDFGDGVAKRRRKVLTDISNFAAKTKFAE